MINSGGQGTIYFTTDGSDPRAVGGAVRGSTYNDKLQVEVSTTLTSGSWQSGNSQVILVSKTHNGDGSSTEVWRSIAPITALGKLFMRLHVTQPQRFSPSADSPSFYAVGSNAHTTGRRQ